MASYSGLRNSGMRLTLFPGSIPTSISQVLLEGRLVKLKCFVKPRLPAPTASSWGWSPYIHNVFVFILTAYLKILLIS